MTEANSNPYRLAFISQCCNIIIDQRHFVAGLARAFDYKVNLISDEYSDPSARVSHLPSEGEIRIRSRWYQSETFE